MSSLDLFEDGYPHGTVQGYQDGCRGSACPGTVEYGMSCRRANELRAGDYRYNRLVAEGKTPTQIAAIIDNTGPDAQQPTPTPTPTKRSPKQPPAEDIGTPAEKSPTPEPDTTASSPKVRRGVPVPDSVRNRIRELNGQGISDTKIAVEVGVSQPTVSKIRREMGLAAVRKFGSPTPDPEPAPTKVDDERYEYTDILDQARERATNIEKFEDPTSTIDAVELNPSDHLITIDPTETSRQLEQARTLAARLEQKLTHTETERDTLTNALQVALAAWGRVRDENTDLQVRNASLTHQTDRLGTAVDALLEQVGTKDARFDALYDTHQETLEKLRVLEVRVAAPWWRRMVGR